MSLPPNLGPRNGILSLTIKDKSVLYAAYMPFIRNGGLFIPTNKNYKLGDEVFMLLNLMEEPRRSRWPARSSGSPRRAPRATVRLASACSSTTVTTPPATRSKPTWPGR